MVRPGNKEKGVLDDSAPDGDVGGEGTFFINISLSFGCLGGFETESYILEISSWPLIFVSELLGGVQEDGALTLERSLILGGGVRRVGGELRGLLARQPYVTNIFI